MTKPFAFDKTYGSPGPTRQLNAGFIPKFQIVTDLGRGLSSTQFFVAAQHQRCIHRPGRDKTLKSLGAESRYFIPLEAKLKRATQSKRTNR